jgi:hypothetical protein
MWLLQDDASFFSQVANPGQNVFERNQANSKDVTQ